MRVKLAAFVAMFSLAALLVSAASTSAAPEHAATAVPVVFTDASGDSGTAPDLTQMSVTNDDQGNYTFVATFGTAYGTASSFFIYLDTDSNPATGDPQSLGSEFVIDQDGSTGQYGFAQWSGSAWVDTPPNVTADVTLDTTKNTLTVVVNKSELNDTAAFNFWVESTDGDGSPGHYDDGPSGSGSWNYKLQVPLTLQLAGSHATAAKAGGTWTMVIAAVRSDTGKTVGPEGAITCSATGHGTKLKLLVRAFVSTGGVSAAVCTFAVPKTLKHKALNGAIHVSYQGITVGKSFTTVVK
jgi:hypothetical protein